MLRIRLDLASLSTVTSQVTYQSAQERIGLRDDLLTSLALHQDGLKGSITQICDQVDQRIDRVEEMLKAQSKQIQTSQSTQIGPLYRARPPYRRRHSSTGSNDAKPANPARAEGVGLRLHQYSTACSPNCHCACHTSRKLATPGPIDRVLGQLFVGYSGLPFISPKCDSDECLKLHVSHVSVEYWFPLGFFWSQIVRLQVGYQPNIGPQFQLSTLRRVPDSAQCVNFALNGNIEGLKGLFIRGLASPRDVSSTRGYSILRVGFLST